MDEAYEQGYPFKDGVIVLIHEDIAVGGHGTNSPINNVCDDVLREIFLLCTAAYGNNNGYDDIQNTSNRSLRKRGVARRPKIKLPAGKQFLSPFPSACNLPFIFLFVSRRWHRVAQDTHSLWDRVSAMPNLSGQGRPSARFIQRWLELSGETTPLFLHIAPSDVSSQFEESLRVSMEEREEKATLGLFFEYAERCKVLSIQFSKGLYQRLDELLHPDSLHSPPKPFTQLDTLEIDTRTVEFSFDLPGWLATFPSLRHIRLIENRFGRIDINELPLSQLETIYLRKHFHLDDALTLLHKCSSATEITLAGTLWGPIFDIPLEPSTTLLNLTKLSIRRCPQPGPLAFLNHFTIPNLCDLEVRWHFMTPLVRLPGQPDSVLLENFLIRSGCRLGRLAIANQLVDPTEIQAILSNPIVLLIPEVEIVYGLSLPKVSKEKCHFSTHLKAPRVLRYVGENEDFFMTNGIEILFWTLVEYYSSKHYLLWESVGWNKRYKGLTKVKRWKDPATGKFYTIKFKLE